MIKKTTAIVIGTGLILGSVGMGATAAYATDEAAAHTTVLWAYPGYPDVTKPQPYVVSTRGATLNAFDDVVKQPELCGKTYQVDVYKSVVKGTPVSTLWSKGYLEYGHDGGFLAYEIGTTPYKVLTGKDTECQTPTPVPTTPPVTPEPSPTGTPTSPPDTTPTPEPTGQPSSPVTPKPEPTPEPTAPVTSPPTTPTEPEPTPTTSPSTPTPVGTSSPIPTTAPTPSPTPSATSTPTNTHTPTTSATPSVPTKTDSGTTQQKQPTVATARTLAYTGGNVLFPSVAAAVLLILGIGAIVIARRRR